MSSVRPFVQRAKLDPVQQAKIELPQLIALRRSTNLKRASTITSR
jgi:hypothetical protein